MRADGKDIFSVRSGHAGRQLQLQPRQRQPELLNGAQGFLRLLRHLRGEARYWAASSPRRKTSPAPSNEAVLSYRTWQKRFGADPNIVGQTLMLNNQPFRVVGVMGPSFNWPNQAELWVPIALPPARYHDANYRYNEYLFAVGAAAPGRHLATGECLSQHEGASRTSPRRAAAPTRSRCAPKSFGRASGWGMFCLPLTEFIGGNLRKPLTMLLIAVGMVLLIACANIAGLQMARASARERELAVRVALGAQRGRLLRQALVESIVLTVAGVVLGFAVGNRNCAAAAALAARHAGHADPAFIPRAGAAVRDRGCGGLFAALRSGSGVAAHAARLVQRAAGGRPLGHQQCGPSTGALIAGGCARLRFRFCCWPAPA